VFAMHQPIPSAAADITTFLLTAPQSNVFL
jgi:hypothetical protein